MAGAKGVALMAAANTSRGREAALLVAVAVFLSLVFVPLSIFRLVDGDEGFYLLAARLVMEGKSPYRDFLYHQMPLLPYLYGAWMSIFGTSWYAARLLSALFAVLLGLLVFRHVARTTNRRSFGLLAVALYALSGHAIGWFSVVKTYPFSTLMIFLAYTLIRPMEGPKWRVFLGGICLGLAADTRGYLVVLTPLAALWILSKGKECEHPTGRLPHFAAGLALALSPNLLFFLASPESFVFNNVGFHAVRSDYGFVGDLWQKAVVAMQIVGLRSPEKAASLQLAVLLFLNACSAIVALARKQPSGLSLYFALALLAVSLLPTPAYLQYFSVAVPFLVVNAVLFIADHADHLFARPYRPLLAMLVVAYLLVSPAELYRYAVSGYNVPGVGDPDVAASWTIPAINRVARAIDESGLGVGEPALSWWPGYFVEARTPALPKTENHGGLTISSKLAESELERYHIISAAGVHRAIAERTVRLVVLGNWLWEPDRSAYRRLLLASGYSLRRQIGDAEVYRWDPE
ncbi:MAG: glycosyltransferase family 39 protein [Chloroflexi bacterium]|nr:glycosyltransferase family 39 protein [Chloroflexota bacterium]